MTELLTAAQMRAIETAAIESGEASGLDLMERAGRGVVDAIFAHWPALAQAPCHAVVLCGPGNNGGDGFVVARLLKAWGWRVELFLYGDPGKLPPDARANCARWQELGPVGDLKDAPRRADGADLYVDALFGTGLGRPLEGAALDWVAAQAADTGSGAKTVAVDMPSGLCSDSGRALGGVAVSAALTVSFHALKLGHVLSAGPGRCGHAVVAGIGLRGGAAEAARRVEAPDCAMLTKVGQAHKFTHGHALVLTGGAGRTGAARLAARAALRIGAGLVTLGVPGSAQIEVACQITALMLVRVDGADGLAGVLEDPRINALCLGPGLGVERARDLVGAALRAGHAPAVVLDADALSAFADGPEVLFEMLHDKCVLTPHAGEFARLFPDLADKLNAPASKGPAWSRLDATRAAAKRAGCVVLLKGADTVIAAPDGRAAVHAAAYERAAPWLATAGAGDVLAGMIAGLLARGYTPMAGARAAAWLHVESARVQGAGLIAEDLPEAIPQVLRDLGC
ncbi:MAG TPA: NAD(P)H-hydrate dehydratase [Roseovarius sp.]|nr:NAD(P)H-hydrate dehydratase [Roseovarius sp.]